MILESAATVMSEVEEATPTAPVEPSEPDFPLPPETLEEAGMSVSAATDLILKTLYARGAQQGKGISEILALRFTLLDDLLLTLQQMEMVEVRGSHGHGREGYTFALTQAGLGRAREAMEINGYVGPAPVPLTNFTSWVSRQSGRGTRITPEALAAAFADLVLKPEVIAMLGPAVNSASSMFLHGEPGNGKTAIAERIARIASDSDIRETCGNIGVTVGEQSAIHGQ